MEKDEIQECTLTEHRAMVCLPENAVDIKIVAKVYLDGELVEVSKALGLSEIREAFEKADNGYIDDNDEFVITDKGKAFLDECERNRGACR